MMQLKEKMKRGRNIVILLPIFGSVIFAALYFIATLLYPGGSQVNRKSIGFSWINNYWCNLLNENAINGEHNPAKPIAVTGMFVLCVTLSKFWLLFAKQVDISKFHKRLIQVSGIISMIAAFLLFLNLDHDLIINVSCCFGLVATIGTIVGLYKIRSHRLFTFGLCCLLLVPLNNYFYYSKGMIVHLPIVQKISFAAFIIWTCCIDMMLYKEKELSRKQS